MSTYKKRHTLKFLIGIAPCGCISFVSAAFPGSIPDNEITEACGDVLESGDAVTADRGFTDFGLMRERGCELIIPSLKPVHGPRPRQGTRCADCCRERTHVPRSARPDPH
mmetsp:Transcript_19132/g.56332  ORF Transcript_19132/g.56332 Transcript_19132/m.56332 type:complete len:110 (-) Transcript_19132:232-561(-)